MDKDTARLIVRWTMAFERHIADYSEPPSPQGYYSVRTAKTFRNKHGRDFEPSVKHKVVWMCLLAVAHDLGKSVTHTWVGKETLKQMAGMSATMFSETLEDLRVLGFVSITPRMNSTHQINLYLFPGQKEREYDVEPVSIAREDMGLYVCKAAVLRGQSEDEPSDEGGIDAVSAIVRMVEFFFEGHPNFDNPRQRAAVARYIARCIEVAGSAEGCDACLRSVFSDYSPKGHACFQSVAAATSLGAYIAEAFPGWWAAYTSQRNDEVVSTI